MKAVRLDLAPRHNRRTMLLAGIVSFLAAAAVFEHQHAAQTELQSWQARWQALSDRKTPGRNDRKEEARLANDIARANRVIARLGIPWGTLFSAVDAIIVPDVTLLSVEPDAEHREVRISAEAKDRNAMLDYARAMLRSPAFQDAHIVSHQINSQDPQKPVRFTATAVWIDVPDKAPVEAEKPQ